MGRRSQLELWGEAIMCATHIQNKKISSTNDMTPFELWNVTKPDMSYFKIFGWPAFAYVPDETRCKLDPKAVGCILVGYCEDFKSFRMWNPVTRKVIISRDVVFKEDAVYEGVTVSGEANYDSLFPLEKTSVVNVIFFFWVFI